MKRNRITLTALLVDDVPPEVLAAARLLDKWNKEQGRELWCLAGTCSRQYQIKYERAQKALIRIQEITNTWSCGF